MRVMGVVTACPIIPPWSPSFASVGSRFAELDKLYTKRKPSKSYGLFQSRQVETSGNARSGKALALFGTQTIPASFFLRTPKEKLNECRMDESAKGKQSLCASFVASEFPQIALGVRDFSPPPGTGAIIEHGQRWLPRRSGSEQAPLPSTARLWDHMWDAGQPAGHFSPLARQPLNLDLVLAALGLVAAVLVGVVIILWVQRWQRRSADASDPGAELDNYRDLFRRGLLSPEEFERIRTRLEGKSSPKMPLDPPANGATKSDLQPPPPGHGMP
jgi:hypothetical protein